MVVWDSVKYTPRYLSDVSDEEWALVAPYLTLMAGLASLRFFAVACLMLHRLTGLMSSPSQLLKACSSCYSW